MKIWIRSELFLFHNALSQSAAVSNGSLVLDFEILVDIIRAVYQETKVPGRVGRALWMWVGSKFGLSKSECALFFDTFSVFAVEDRDLYRISDFAQFLFFQLFVPQTQSPARTKSASYPDIRKNSPRSPRSPRSPARSTLLKSRSNLPAQQLTYVKQQLSELIRLTFHQFCDTPDIRTGELRPADVDLLGFTFSGGPDFETEVQQLSQAVRWPKSRIMPIPELMEILTASLTNNNFAYPAIGRSSKALPMPPRPAKSLTKGMEPVPRPLVIHEFDGKVHMHTNSKYSNLVPDAVVTLCDKSIIYILSPVGVVSILGCSRSTIVIGAAAKTVVVEKCQNVTIICCTRHICISNCLDSKFYIHTLTRPHLVGDNRGVGLAPYNAGYPDLLHHLKLAGLPSRASASSTVNLWNQPMEPTARETNLSTSWHLVRPEDFNHFVIPVENVTPDDNPFHLPAKYASALQRREKTLQDTRARVAAANLTPTQTADFEQAISVKFQEYLQRTGHIRELAGLIRHAIAEGKASELSASTKAGPQHSDKTDASEEKSENHGK